MSRALAARGADEPWEQVALADLVEFRRGLTYKKSDEVEHSSNAVLRANNIDLETGLLDLSDIRYISPEVEIPPSKKVIPDSLLICTASGSRSHLGKVAYLEGGLDYAFGGFMGLLAPGPRICPKYLYYFTRSTMYWEFIGSLSAGANINNLRFADLGKLVLPLPRVPEQKRIVSVLDQAFAALDRARANAEANLTDTQNFFLTALRSIFSNNSRKWLSNERLQLTTSATPAPTGRRSKVATQTGGRDATTRPIEGDYSLSVLMPRAEAREGWAWSPLSELARLESGHTPSRKHPEYWGGDIGWMGIKDARDHHGDVITQTREQTNALGIKNSSARVLPKGTVCLSRTASVGYVVTMGADMATSQDFVNWICGPHLEPDFLKFLLLAQGDDIRKFASGSVHQTIYFPEVKAFHISHPSRDVQKQICKSLHRLRDEAVRMEDAYRSKLADIADLRQSLLQKAFSGQLT